MSKKQIVILVSLGLFVVAAVVAGLISKGRYFVSTGPSDGASGLEDVFAKKVPGSNGFYTPAVPENAELSKPKLEAPASANSSLDTKMRFFDLRATKGGFEPSSFTVNKGDTLQVDFTAIDADYDLDIPHLGAYFKVVKRGESRRLPFSASAPGTFIFQCRDYCPAGGPIKGQLIVLP